MILPISASQVARVTGVSHWCPATLLNNFYVPNGTNTFKILMAAQRDGSHNYLLAYR
jgi:hypothetical protein